MSIWENTVFNTIRIQQCFAFRAMLFSILILILFFYFIIEHFRTEQNRAENNSSREIQNSLDKSSWGGHSTEWNRTEQNRLLDF